MIRKAARLGIRALTFPAHYIHCKLDPISYSRSLGVTIGSNVRILGMQPNGSLFGSEPYLIRIGNDVTITAGVHFVTHDGGMWTLRREIPTANRYGPISVGNNVFIGISTIVLPNVHIGDNVVIGAGSVVTKSVPDNSVFAGVPARFICGFDDYRKRNMARIDKKVFSDNNEKRAYLCSKYLQE